MAYRFKFDEPMQKGVRRIAREQFEKILFELSAADVAPAGIHEIRKGLKRMRALVRLVGPAIGAKNAGRRNAALKSIAKLMSGHRDETVCVETFAKLETSAGVESSATLAPLKAYLAGRAPQLARPLDAEIVERARRMLTKEARRLDKIKVKGFAALQPGLEDSYRTGRKALKKAYAKPTDDAFHDLRKAAQWHWRQMSLLSRAWPEAFEVRVAAARDVSQILGDDHDLAVLQHAARTAGTIDDTALKAISNLCKRHQADLRAAAHPRAVRLFAEPPKAFVRRVSVYWQAGRRVVTQNPRNTRGASEQKPAELNTAAAALSTPRLAAKTPGQVPSQRRA